MLAFALSLRALWKLCDFIKIYNNFARFIASTFQWQCSVYMFTLSKMIMEIYKMQFKIAIASKDTHTLTTGKKYYL